MSDLTFKLLKWQQEVMGDKTRYKVICAGWRCGKSRLAAVTLLIRGLQCPQAKGDEHVKPQ